MRGVVSEIPPKRADTVFQKRKAPTAWCRRPVYYRYESGVPFFSEGMLSSLEEKRNGHGYQEEVFEDHIAYGREYKAEQRVLYDFFRSEARFAFPEADEVGVERHHEKG